MADSEPVKAIQTPTRIEYTYSPGRASTRFLRAMEQGRIMGQKCTGCGKVYVPPRGACPKCGLPTEDEVDLPDKGTVVSFTVVRVPSENIQLELPYATASILLDGADIPFQALLRDVEVADVRPGMRVQAQWKDRSEFGPTFQNIKWFHPIDEPDVPFEKFKEHL